MNEKSAIRAFFINGPLHGQVIYIPSAKPFYSVPNNERVAPYYAEDSDEPSAPMFNVTRYRLKNYNESTAEAEYITP